MNWHNVNANEPCPICHKTDWCNLSDDGIVCICHRVESPRIAKSGIGWIHRLRDGAATWMTPRMTPRTPPKACVLDFARIHAGYDADPILVEGLATTLGVRDEALKALDVRFNRMDECWSFPMRDAEGKIVGLRFRELCGRRKWSARGSRDGLFVPAYPAAHTGALVIVEGPSDVAALMSHYLDLSGERGPMPMPMIVGRSSCETGAEALCGYMRRMRPRRVTVVADNDEPGIRGANRLAGRLSDLAAAIPVRVKVVPSPHKDIREWYLRGGEGNRDEG